MLCVLVFQEQAEGRDPMRRYRAEAPRDPDGVKKEYQFRDVILKALINPVNVHVLRSNIEFWRRIRTHHKHYIDTYWSTAASLKYACLRASPDAWLEKMVLTRLPRLPSLATGQQSIARLRKKCSTGMSVARQTCSSNC